MTKEKLPIKGPEALRELAAEEESFAILKQVLEDQLNPLTRNSVISLSEAGWQSSIHLMDPDDGSSITRSISEHAERGILCLGGLSLRDHEDGPNLRYAICFLIPPEALNDAYDIEQYMNHEPN